MGALEEQGFELIGDALDRRTVSSLIDALEITSVHRSRAGMRKAFEIDAVRSLAFDSSLVNLAKQALGNSAIPFRATLFDKSQTSNWHVVWHQDTALPLRERREVPGWGPWSMKEGVICAHAPASALEQILAIRVHIDDSTAENGPLRVLPGTHKLGALSDDAIQELAARLQPLQPFECAVPSGGILLMKPLLVHASSKAKNGWSRRVLHIEYAANKCLPGGLELPI